MRRYLCLFLPRWPIQCHRRTNPQAAEQPCALFERTHHGSHIVVCSSEASVQGLRTGMSLADARALVPTLWAGECELSAYTDLLKRLCLWATRFTPLVAMEPTGEHAAYPQALVLDITGCEAVFGGEDTLVDRVQTALKRQKLKARLAVAPTQGAAWALAHYGPLSCRISEEPEALKTALEPLPLAALRLSPEIIAAFQPLGIHRVGDIQKLPRNAIPSRFGATVLNRLDQAFGIRPEKFIPLRPAPEFRVAKSFQYPVANTEILFRILEQMVQRLADELQKAERGARQIECWFHHEIAEPASVEIALHRCSAGKKHLWQLLRTRLEDHFRAKPHAKRKEKKKITVEHQGRVIEVDESVEALALHVTASEPLQDKQLPLFERKQDGESADFNLLLDRLVTKLGAHAVLNVQLEDDPLPERGYRVVPLDASRRAHPAVLSVSRMPERPVKLLPKPISIQMNGACFIMGGVSFEIQRIHSLERIESGWWREEDQRRDYYVIECTNGARYWLFNDLIRSEWFLHGCFD